MHWELLSSKFIPNHSACSSSSSSGGSSGGGGSGGGGGSSGGGGGSSSSSTTTTQGRAHPLSECCGGHEDGEWNEWNDD